MNVPDDAAEERKDRIRRTAQKNGDVPSEEILTPAHWTMVIPNILCTRATDAEILVVLRLRWHVERLFRLWKEEANIDEWRAKNLSRIVCECYAKMCAMSIQHAFIQERGWLDPHRSLVRATDSLPPGMQSDHSRLVVSRSSVGTMTNIYQKPIHWVRF